MGLNAEIPLSVKPPQITPLSDVAAKVSGLKRLALENQQAEQQVAAQQKAVADTATMDAAWKSAFTPNANGVLTLDRAKLTESLAKGGLGSKVSLVLKGLDDADEAAAKAKKAASDAEEAGNDVIGGLAFSVKHAGDTPEAFETAVRYLQMNNRITPEQSAQYLQTAKTDPSSIGKMTDALVANSPKYTKLAQDEAQHVETAQHDRALEGAAKTTADRLAEQAAETQRHNEEVERINALTSGRQAAQLAETTRHDKAMEAATNPFASTAASAGGAAPSAAAEGPHGDEFLKTLNPSQASEVKAYAEGKRPFPTGMSYYKLQPLIALVSQYDPSFDAGNYNARNKARTDLTSQSGTGGKTINALNTAIQHAGKLSDLIETLDNFESPAANMVVNPIRTLAGKTAVTNYNAVAPQLAKEIERAWRGAGGSAAEIQDLIKTIGSNLGRQQQREALQQFVDLAKGKLDSTQQQRDNVLGPIAGKDVPILFEQNKSIIDKIGKRAGGAASAAPAATAHSVGDTVTLRSGEKVTIKKLNPDGTFEY